MSDQKALAALMSEWARDPARVDAFESDPASALAGIELGAADRAALTSGDEVAIRDRICTVRCTVGKPLVVGGSGGHGLTQVDLDVLPHLGRTDLTVVGSGYLLDGQLTPQSAAAIEQADAVFTVVDELTFERIAERNSAAESLNDLYQVGEERNVIYQRMIDRVLAPLYDDQRVTLVLYGHPGVFATPGHGAVRQARAAGFSARMLPAVSAEDALFADLGIDPAVSGCQSYDATDFLLYDRQVDLHAALVLWQVGGIGVSTFEAGALWSRKGVEILAEVLAERYGKGHAVVLYRASEVPICPPEMRRLPVVELATAPASLFETLYVPPIGPPSVDAAMAERLGIEVE